MKSEHFDALFGALADAGVEAGAATLEYISSRARHLAAIVGEDGYEEALKAETHSVMLFQLGRAIDLADAADAAAWQTFRTVLAIAVRLLV